MQFFSGAVHAPENTESRIAKNWGMGIVMKKIFFSLVAALSMGIAGVQSVQNVQAVESAEIKALTQGRSTGFFEAGVVYPVQFYSRIDNINGIRLALPGVVNNDVNGLDVGIAGISQNFNGVALGIYSGARKNGNGLFVNAINQSGNVFNGAQLGVVNLSGFETNRGTAASLEHSNGAQLGVVNCAANYFVGLQLAVCNATNNGSGLQLGLVNLVQPNQEMNGRLLKSTDTVNINANQVVQIGFVNMNPGAKYPLSFGYEPLQRVICDSGIWLYEKTVALFAK
ncbi:MAG: hypothetical protein MST10_02165 [Lentisphaeria bacterium]|nr:hypothetical protein [Lentisphaeria bacterium]